MYKPVSAIEVRIWGETVGAVALDPKLGYYAFEYDPRFVISGISHSDLLAVADRFGIGTAPQVLKQVGEAVSTWPDFAAQAGVGPAEIRRVLEHHRVL